MHKIYFNEVKIDISELQQNSGSPEVVYSSADYPSLQEIGVVGDIRLKSEIIPVDKKYWIKGFASGEITQECPKCTAKINCKFLVELKIWANFTGKKEIIWGGDDSLNFDEYSVTMGPNTVEIEVVDQVREQILLNCSIMNPSDNLEIPDCPSCLPLHKAPKQQKLSLEVDPRWEKLKDLL